MPHLHFHPSQCSNTTKVFCVILDIRPIWLVQRFVFDLATANKALPKSIELLNDKISRPQGSDLNREILTRDRGILVMFSLNRNPFWFPLLICLSPGSNGESSEDSVSQYGAHFSDPIQISLPWNTNLIKIPSQYWAVCKELIEDYLMAI